MPSSLYPRTLNVLCSFTIYLLCVSWPAGLGVERGEKYIVLEFLWGGMGLVYSPTDVEEIKRHNSWASINQVGNYFVWFAFLRYGFSV